MSKAILRTAKLKTFGNIGGSLAHNYRTINTPNADPSRTPNNIHSLPNAESVKNAIQNRLPEKRRSDAVLCIEYLITASPEWSGWQDGNKTQEYFNRSIEWLKEKHGAENVVATSIHFDETTPHLVAYVVPLDDKQKLNCKLFLGGKKKLSDMQTDFAKKVKDLGLERGKQNSKATHKTIQEFYADINQINKQREIADLQEEVTILRRENLRLKNQVNSYEVLTENEFVRNEFFYKEKMDIIFPNYTDTQRINRLLEIENSQEKFTVYQEILSELRGFLTEQKILSENGGRNVICHYQKPPAEFVCFDVVWEETQKEMQAIEYYEKNQAKQQEKQNAIADTLEHAPQFEQPQMTISRPKPF